MARRLNLRPLVFLLIFASGAVGAASGCATSRKQTPELARLEGKKVALVEVEAEETSRSVIEVALVNQLIKRGTFLLVSKQDVEAARTAADINPADPIAVAKRAGADFALKAKVVEFDAHTREGYSEEEVEDSQLAAERGESARKTKRVYKVQSLTGQVRIQLQFIPIGRDSQEMGTRTGLAEAHDEVFSEAKREAAHLPPKLRFLENLSNEAFRKFFEQYN